MNQNLIFISLAVGLIFLFKLYQLNKQNSLNVSSVLKWLLIAGLSILIIEFITNPEAQEGFMNGYNEVMEKNKRN